MIAEDLSIFIDSIINYFQTMTDVGCRVGSPFLIKEVDSFVCDYTGVISVTGEKQGLIFFSAPQRMISRILRDMGLLATRESLQLDLVGEICNTVSGNARRRFGENFKISVPEICHGDLHNIMATNFAGIYVIPLQWHDFEARLIMNLSD